MATIAQRYGAGLSITISVLGLQALQCWNWVDLILLAAVPRLALPCSITVVSC